MIYLMLITIFLPILAAPAVYFIGKKNNRVLHGTAIAVCFCTLCLSILPFLLRWTGDTADCNLLGLHFTAGGLGGLYSVITALLWTLAAMFAPRYFQGKISTPRYIFFFLITLGATAGVFLAADLMTLFLFFEVMSLASCAWVAHEETKKALEATKTYLTISVTGGLVLLMGLFLLYHQTGTLMIRELSAAADPDALLPACLCLLFGFGTKAGIFPLHIWLPKAHPEAPAPASALLSGVLTKTGCFGAILVTLRLMSGSAVWNHILLILGMITMLTGAIPALFATQIKRILALSSLSQIGFIFTGIAMIGFAGEKSVATQGTILYMVNHSLAKTVLFLFAGAVYCTAHTLELNELRGWGKGRPLLHVCFLSGALSLAGTPLFCGYLGKTLIHEAIAEYAAEGGALFHVAEWVFLFAGGLTLAYLLKIYIPLFHMGEKQKHTKEGKLRPLAAAAPIPCVIFLPLIAIVPALCRSIAAIGLSGTGIAPLPADFAYYSLHNLTGIGISFAVGIAVYLGIIQGLLYRDGKYRTITSPVSMERTVYVPVCKVLKGILILLCRIVCDLPAILLWLFRKAALRPLDSPHDRRHRFLKRLGDAYDRIRGKSTRDSADLLIDTYTTIQDTTGKILSNFSFALLMTCLGVCIILIFLLVK